MSSESPPWETIEKQLSGPPMRHRLLADPDISIQIDGTKPKLSLLCQFLGDEQFPEETLEEIDQSLLNIDGKRFLRVSTVEKDLFPVFYSFVLSVSEIARLEKCSPMDALQKAYIRWRALLKRRNYLSPEKEIGLFGELWLALRLSGKVDGNLSGIWSGLFDFQNAIHDFRLGMAEIEVKTTTREDRSHFIHGCSQLEPSPGKSLYLLSIQIVSTNGREGRSLSEMINDVAETIQEEEERKTYYGALKQKYNLSDADIPLYTKKYSLRTLPKLILIDEEFPSITCRKLSNIKSIDISLIDELNYRLKVEKFGFEDGTPEFLSLIP